MQSKDVNTDKQVEKESDIQFSDLIATLWRKKLIIISVTALFAIIGVIYTLQLKNIYSSEALLAPVASDAGGVGGLLGGIGGLANLAGISLSKGSSDKATIGIQTLRSRMFVKSFIEKERLAVILLAVEDWNKNSRELVINEDIYDANSDTWLSTNLLGEVGPPTDFELHEKFTDNLRVAQDIDTGFVTMSFVHKSPIVAKTIIEKLILEINNTIRNSDIQKAQMSISYLQGELGKTSIAELKTGIYSLIQSQTEKIMIANATPEYIFQVIDPPVVSINKYKPKRALICILMALVGALSSCFYVLFREFFK